MKLFLYLSEILGKRVVDTQGRVVGRLSDVPMRIGEEVYPRAAGLVIKRGLVKPSFAYVDSQDVAEVGDVQIRLKIADTSVNFKNQPTRYDFTLCRDILDQQVVDTNNHKVVRVNDVHLLRVDNHLYLAHVDIGLRALVRRLEWTPVIDTCVRAVSPRSPYLHQEDFISWKNTQALISGRSTSVVWRDASRKKLSQISSADLAEILEDLDIFEKMPFFKSLDVLVQRRVFADSATSQKRELIEHLDDREAAALLENSPADEATDVLMTLSKAKTQHLLKHMQTKKSKKLHKLLGFEKDSAGGLMTTEYLFLKKDALVRDAIQLVRDNLQYPGGIYQIYIVDENHRFMGSTSLRQFFNSPPETPIMETCYSKKIFVQTDDGMEKIALLLEKYKFTSIAVLNEEEVLQGVITIDDVMEALISLAWAKYKDRIS